MAKNPIEIPIASETKAFAQGIESGVIKPVEDAQKALDDLGRTQGPEQLERSIDDAATATQRLEKEVDETADAIEREFRQAYARQTQAAQGAARGSSAAMQEVKAEAISNASETFSSFDGSAQSFVSGIQGTFGGLIAGLASVKPALVPIAAAAAVAIGAVAAAVTGAAQNTEEFRAKVAELAAEYIESGTIGGRSFGGVADEIRGLATETDSAKASLVRFDGLAKDLRDDFADVVAAYAGGGEPLDNLITKTEELAAQERVRALELQGSNEAASVQASNRAADLEHELGLLRTQRDALAEAAVQQELYYSAGVGELEAKVGLIEALNSAYDDAAASTQEFIDKESGVFDVEEYIEAMDRRAQALLDYQETLAGSGLSNEAKSFLNEQGVEAAAQMLAGYKSADAETRAELDRIWTEAGRDNSGSYTKEITQQFASASVKAPTVEFDAEADADAYRSAFLEAMRRNPIEVPMRVKTRYGTEIG